MKYSAFVFVLTIAVAATAAPTYKPVPSVEQRVAEPNSMCDICIQFMEQSINALLNIILQMGVEGTCANVCSQLPNPSEATVCELLCIGVGFDAFVHILEKEGDLLDPVFFCEELHTCPINDGGAVSIDEIKFLPSAMVPYGSTLTLTLLFTVTNATGTVTINFDIESDALSLPVGDGDLAEGLAPGGYNMTWQIKVEDEMESSFPLIWDNGEYATTCQVCNGGCDTRIPHAGVLASATKNFTVTGGSDDFGRDY